MSEFYWDDLVEGITQHRNVVPVVGLDLAGAAERPGGSTFYEDLVALCSTKFRFAGLPELPPHAEFKEFVSWALTISRSRAEFARVLSAAHRELLSRPGDEILPESLQTLAQIQDFPLVLTACTDGLVSRAFEVPEDSIMASTLSEVVDLPSDWRPPARGTPPTLVHLFGRITATPGFAFNEEDVLEFMCNLYGEMRPSRLLSRLRRSHILILGTCFPDWLARFFLRVLRGTRLSTEGETFEAIADSEARSPRPLVAFLKPYNPQIRVYDQGTPADFVKELEARWRELQPAGISADSSVEDFGEPADMADGSVFVSYASEDRAAAAALAASLSNAGIDAWFDRNELRGGDRYNIKIRSHIRRCSLFVPVMSQHTEARQDAYFRREWTWARDRLNAISPTRPFIIPIVIDALDAKSSPDLSHYFEMQGRELHVLRIPGGALDAQTTDQFIYNIRQVNARRASAIA